MTFPASVCGVTAQAGGQIGLRGGDGLQIVFLLQSGSDTQGEESRQGRAKADAPDAQRQQRQQHADGFLLKPAQDDGEGQFVDRAAKGVRQRQRDLDGAVGVVALAHVQDAGQAGVGICRRPGSAARCPAG